MPLAEQVPRQPLGPPPGMERRLPPPPRAPVFPDAAGEDAVAGAPGSASSAGQEPGGSGVRYRSGKCGGRERFGDSGGQHREYYRGLYAAKGQGKMREYIATHGPPPSRGGTAYHPRKAE